MECEAGIHAARRRYQGLADDLPVPRVSITQKGCAGYDGPSVNASSTQRNPEKFGAEQVHPDLFHLERGRDLFVFSLIRSVFFHDQIGEGDKGGEVA